MRELRSRLARRTRLHGRGQRGAIGVLVAVLIGGGVLLGMGALVLDAGQIYQERAELQNGADAAALGVAKSCALGGCAPSDAKALANANASSLTGGLEQVRRVCGSGTLASCPPSTTPHNDCPPSPATGNFVDVYTGTQMPSGTTLLPPVFAGTLLGNSNYQGTTVYACAQAEWGAPTSATVTALTISDCEWVSETNNGTSFTTPSSVGVITTTNLGSGTGCGTPAAPYDPILTFGWAASTGGCSLTVSGGTGASFPSTPAGAAGQPPGTTATSPSDCMNVLDNAQDSQIPITIPVYDSFDSTAQTYTLEGFATFMVTGYSVNGNADTGDSDDSGLPSNGCEGATTDCISGYFTRGIIPATGNLTGTNLGTSIVDLTG